MKNFILIIVFIGLLACLNACSPAYVAVQPTYVDTDRSVRPTSNHVWVDGNWVYNRRSRSYVHKSGYWTVPYRNRAYVAGQWKSNPRGHYWQSGRWR